MNYNKQQEQVELQHHSDIGFAMLRVLLMLTATVSLGGVALSFLFQHELSPMFSAMFLVVIAAMAGGVIQAFTRYGYDAKQADARRERSLRMLRIAVEKHANYQFS